MVREPGQVVTEILLHDLAVVLASYGTQIHLEGFLPTWISVPAGPGYGAVEPAGDTAPPLHSAGMTSPIAGRCYAQTRLAPVARLLKADDHASVTERHREATCLKGNSGAQPSMLGHRAP